MNILTHINITLIIFLSDYVVKKNQIVCNNYIICQYLHNIKFILYYKIHFNILIIQQWFIQNQIFL